MSETSTAARLQDVAWPIHTERLTLRPAVKADLDATWRIRRLDAVNQWITSAPADRESYRTLFEDPGRLAKTLLIELDGVVIGDLMLSIEDAWAQSEVAAQARGVQAELGWCLDPEQAGRGYATEAVAALIRLCFEDLAPTPGHGQLLRRQRGVVAPHGATGHAPRGAHDSGLAAQVG